MKKILTLLTIIYLISICVFGYAGVVLTVKKEVTVEPAKTITISDIADIKASSELAQKIGAVRISAGPISGASRTISLPQIKTKLKANNLDNGVVYQGAMSCIVKAEAIKITAEELSDEAVNFVLSQLPSTGLNYQAVIERMPRELTISSVGSYEIKPKLMRSSAGLGPNSVALDVIINGRRTAGTTAVVRVSAQADVLVALSHIPMGEMLTLENCSWQARDITNIKEPVLMSEGGAIGDFVARRSIGQGAVVTAGDLKVPDTITRGETITVVVNCNGIKVTSPAQARQSGRVGDIISVRAEVSQQDVRGTITAPGIVEITR
ncbi:MAG: flagellar basal body P-ring formation chaperone FlgA [Armatimonadota bacterium]